jgi:hypothetical protein
MPSVCESAAHLACLAVNLEQLQEMTYHLAALILPSKREFVGVWEIANRVCDQALGPQLVA